MRYALGIAIVLVFLLSSATGFGQNGNLEVMILSVFGEDEELVQVELLFEDSIIEVKDYRFEVRFDSLPPGEYKVNILYRKKSAVTYHKVGVSADSTTTIYSQLLDLEKEANIDTLDGLIESNMQVLYSNGGGPLGYSLYSSAGLNYWTGLSKVVDFGAGLAYYFDLTKFDETTPINGLDIEKQRYINLGVRVELRGRIAFFEHRDAEKFGFHVDYGAAYKLPALFRFVSIEGNQRISQTKLHSFKDLRPFVSFGYSPVSLYAEYRMFDFVKDDLPQLSKFNFGINILISQ